MINGARLCVVLPAYNAARTLQRTIDNIDRRLVDDVIVVDDGSTDATRDITRQLGINYVFHDRNRGYGGNQKTCYAMALGTGADIVVMLHPDYQYDPRLVSPLAQMVASGIYDVAIASRILGKGALAGGMPVYKYLSNRILTLVQNLMIGQKLSEYHTGFRAFSRHVLESLPLLANSDDFLFDNQMLIQCHRWGFRIAEISCPTRYFPEASSINFWRSVKYGLGTLGVSLAYLSCRLGFAPMSFLDLRRAAEFKLTKMAIQGRIVETNIGVGIN